MRHSHKQNGGFTLVELVIAIAVAALVTAAATTVLMLALRVNRQAGDTASNQNTVRALLTAMEKAAAEGNIKNLESSFDSWVLKGDDEREIFRYSSEKQSIYTNGTEILRDVYASHATYVNGLLTISVETASSTYSYSVFCRTWDGENVNDEIPNIPDTEQPEQGSSLGAFLDILKSQYGSTGEILVENNGMMVSSGVYYSEWYINCDYDDTVDDAGWNPKTPWCACYVSWALVESGVTRYPGDKWYAEVDDFLSYFGGVDELSSDPKLGDIVFFDWDKDGDPQHVGVVLGVYEEKDERGNIISTTIYTIEGNSAGRVMVRSYSIDSQYILGYGHIDW